MSKLYYNYTYTSTAVAQRLALRPLDKVVPGSIPGGTNFRDEVCKICSSLGVLGYTPEHVALMR